MRGNKAFTIALLVMCVLLSPLGLWANSEGKGVYRARCTSCHGPDGSPRANKKMSPPDLRAKATQSQSDAELFEGIAYGARHKQYPHAFIYKGLSDRQIRAIVALIRTFKEAK
jgi:mono/diheme cytochrome c family protein